MPLVPKDEVDESGAAQKANQSDEALEELRERVDDLDERTAIPMGLDTLDELNTAQQSQYAELEERVTQIEERVLRQQTAISDLIESVELLGASVGKDGVMQGAETLKEDGSGHPWKWSDETLTFKSE